MSEVTKLQRLRQAYIRLEAKAESGTGDRWIPPLASFALAATLIWIGITRLRSLRAGAQLAGYTQAIWLLSEGYRPEASLFGAGRNVLTVHWSFVLYPLSVLARWFDPSYVLIVVQGVSMGLGCWFLWSLARRVAHLRIGGSLALVVAYSLHPATHQLGAIGFHPESIAVPALFAVALFSSQQRWLWYWVAVAAVLASRADYGLALALWGIVLVSSGDRSQGLWTAGVSAGWTLGLLLVAEPLLSRGSNRSDVYGAYGESLSEAGINILVHPFEFVTALVSEQNTLLMVSVLFPVMFLPILSLRYFLPALPLSALLIVATTGSPHLFAERAGLLYAFVMIASVFALARFGSVGVTQVFVDIRVLAALVIAAMLGFVSQAPDSPYRKPWDWRTTTTVDESVMVASSLLDSDDAVRASSSSLELLAERRWLYELDDSQQPRVIFASSQVRAVLIDERDLPPLNDESRLEQRESFAGGMAQQGFDPVYQDPQNGVWLYYRE